MICDPSLHKESESVNLFTHLPLYVEDESSSCSLERQIENCNIDFDNKVKEKLKSVVKEIKDIVPIDEGYAVQVRIKDPSVYAFAPRRLAHAERLQLREITDDLLARGIIKPSISPYCARVVPVRKKNGKIRLCVDLRPLNVRVHKHKQKYPFPRMEDCLAKLANKKVFTLLDLRDGFHQIAVEKDSTKY